ncbi:MAG: methyltransferase FkbM family [uncultured bacterium]|nr:MAG: methyltransferase FkbM family [uncultured bacterium]
MDRLNYWFNFVKVYKNWLQIIILRIFGKNITKVILRNGIVIKGSSSTSLGVVMDETFVLKRYTPKFLNIKRGEIVVDIGSHVGDFSILSALQGASKVYAYEPDPNTFLILKNNIISNNLQNIKIINLAVIDKVGSQSFFQNQDDGGNSIYDILRTNKSILVKTTTIDEIMISQKLERIDFLKIDCEGSEGLIFKSIPIKTLKKINKISMEYHDNVSELNHMQIIKKLESAGFKTKLLKTGNQLGYIYAIQKL